MHCLRTVISKVELRKSKIFICLFFLADRAAYTADPNWLILTYSPYSYQDT